MADPTTRPATISLKKRSAARKPAGRAPKPQVAGSTDKQAATDEPLDLGAEFLRLERFFRSFNTVCTFVLSKRHSAIAFSSVQPSVEGLFGDRISEQDVAAVAVLCPSMLRLGHGHKIDYDDKLYEDLKSIASPDASRSDPQLILEFVDIDPAKKTQVCELSKIIEARNMTFRASLRDFHKLALQQGEDPLEKLWRTALQVLPEEPKTFGGAIRSGSPSQYEPIAKKPRLAATDEAIDAIKQERFYHGQIVAEVETPGREASFGFLDEPLPAGIRDGLERHYGIKKLYRHQTDALNHISQGHHVVVTTPTSSGKSLIYQLPVLRSLEDGAGGATTIYIFPTKALAQDQKQSFGNLLSQCTTVSEGIISDFDGDTPRDVRRSIRDNCQVIFTNPDTLHYSILPHHSGWRGFLSRLRYVVIDELHHYTEAFGTHCAMIIRRLRRICEHYDNHGVQFICCSATIANPKEHFSTLVGLDSVKIVDQDGAPSGSKRHIIWKAGLRKEKSNGTPVRTQVEEVAELFIGFLHRGIRTICFSKSRMDCEILFKEIVATARRMYLNPDALIERISCYRAGYSASERRSIEHKMFKGELLGLISTSALELGIDIGSLDAVLHLSFPSSLASYRQQAGRAGRRSLSSVSILIAIPGSPIDEFYLNNPDSLVDSSYSAALLCTDNKWYLEQHLHCAAAEIPLNIERDAKYFGESAGEVMQANLFFDPQNNIQRITVAACPNPRKPSGRCQGGRHSHKYGYRRR
ncbi:P-loop containing nucleoside triphosphate hydrolase protein [Polychytrium aggregatum]|uniref:P-loop containing nucleoside triphosphate hydrolase protein n=1 Tax=Polychytrium aggregatum TaxID=110093 RepID=UPI0022FE3EA2|nr:P-loop containing nucleoside triphosphate hydrolase protein [Polychytrium aggregatum]KAI9205814.1 P-loop containing nucleoside triphosphate hydrolase protein [Polychytrium aggregatum]